MKNVYQTVKQPLITEKSTLVREANGTYCFKVHVDANKHEIARAVEKLFESDKVKVAEVRTSVRLIAAFFGFICNLLLGFRLHPKTSLRGSRSCMRGVARLGVGT